MSWFKSFWRKPSAPLPSTSGNSVEPRRIFSAAEETAGNFTPRAQQALALARKEADRFHHNFVGTEHLLLGILKLGQGVAVNVLLRMGLELETVRSEVEKQVGTGPDQKMIGNIPYTPRVKKVLALAAKEAKTLNHTYVGTEHILLGLIREGDGVAARVLKDLNVDLEQTRHEILRELDPNFRPSAEAAGTPPAATTSAPPQAPAPPSAASTQPQGQAVDNTKRYDVYCTDGSQGTVVYRNARFKGIKHLFPELQDDTVLGFVELEQGDGQTIFVSRTAILRFCEPGTPPETESDSGRKP
jgi:hypothetical protein